MQVTVIARILDRAISAFVEKDLKTFDTLEEAEEYVRKCRKVNPHIQFFYKASDR